MSVQESFYSESLNANVEDLIAGTWTISAKPVTATAGWYTVSKDDPARREVVYISAFPTATTATVTLRGQSGTTAKTHESGEPFELCTDAAWYNDHETAIAARLLKAGDTMTGALQFSGTDHAGIRAINLTTAQITALGAVADGFEVYDTTTGEYKDRIAGAWVVRAAGGVFPNADAATAGKLELATQAESDAGTDVGGTLASLALRPKEASLSAQKNTWTYIASAGAANAYTATYAPAIAALVVGMELTFLANAACTGPCTFNPNGLGAQAIKKNVNVALAANDILASQMVRVKWDGTNWQMMSPVGNAALSAALLPAKGNLISASAALTPATLTVGADETILIAKSTEAAGLKWAKLVATGTIANSNNIANSASPGTDTDTVVAHGLGRIPRLVRISLSLLVDGNTNAINGYGTAEWTSASATPVSMFIYHTGTSAPAPLTGAQTLTVTGKGGQHDSITVSVISMDATNFTFRLNNIFTSADFGSSALTNCSWVAI